MKAKTRDFIVFGFTLLTLGLISSITYCDKFWGDQGINSKLLYDILLAFLGGCLVFLLTVSMPQHLTLLKIKFFVRKEFFRFEEYLNTRLKRLEINNLPITNSSEIKKKINDLKYGENVVINISAFQTFNEIYDRTKEFYLNILPYSIQLESTGLMDKIRNIRENELFGRRLLYLAKRLEEIEDRKVEIGGFFCSFLEAVESLKKELNR